VLESPSSSPSPMKTRPREEPRARGELDPAAGRRAPGARDGKATKAKKVASHAASLPRGEPSCQIVQRAPEDAHVSLERRRKNHDRAIDDIDEASKNVKTPGDPIYNPRCLALTR
jgi:hypothetical protein